MLDTELGETLPILETFQFGGQSVVVVPFSFGPLDANDHGLPKLFVWIESARHHPDQQIALAFIVGGIRSGHDHGFESLFLFGHILEYVGLHFAAAGPAGQWLFHRQAQIDP